MILSILSKTLRNFVIEQRETRETGGRFCVLTNISFLKKTVDRNASRSFYLADNNKLCYTNNSFNRCSIRMPK